MKKIVFMGKSGSGKTTLCQKLDDLEIKYKKTQSVELYNDSIDTPGEYMEHRYYYSALVVISSDVKVIGVVYDATQEENYIAPGFSSMFCKDVIGIVTKINISTKKQIEIACERLKEAGINKVFLIDTIDEIGLENLYEYLKSIE